MKKFTFQYGEIKSEKQVKLVSRMYKFTFQYGEIKRLQSLKTVSYAPAFTFQYGEIKSGDPCCDRLYGTGIYIPVWRD